MIGGRGGEGNERSHFYAISIVPLFAKYSLHKRGNGQFVLHNPMYFLILLADVPG
jgi:hypothetical protein